jgi:hypothetical protein
MHIVATEVLPTLISVFEVCVVVVKSKTTQHNWVGSNLGILRHTCAIAEVMKDNELKIEVVILASVLIFVCISHSRSVPSSI